LSLLSPRRRDHVRGVATIASRGVRQGDSCPGESVRQIRSDCSCSAKRSPFAFEWHWACRTRSTSPRRSISLELRPPRRVFLLPRSIGSNRPGHRPKNDHERRKPAPTPKPSRYLSLLEKTGVASRCSESWDKMVGDNRMRLCGKCEKNVSNLSAMRRAEAAVCS